MGIININVVFYVVLFLIDGIVNLVDTGKHIQNIKGEEDLNLVVNSNSEFLDKVAAIEKIDTCDSKITINDLNAKVREVSLYVCTLWKKSI